jgi:multimeric flavodoxin WrbA
VTPTLLIVWHSRTGGSRQMAKAVERAARAQEGVTVSLQSAGRTRPEHVLAASGLILIGPENLAGLSGAMKDFFDRCYYPLLDRCPGLPYAALICAGSDGSGAHRQLARIAQGLRWRPVCEPLIVNTGAQSAESILAPKQIGKADLDRCAEIGATLAAGLAMGIW